MSSKNTRRIVIAVLIRGWVLVGDVEDEHEDGTLVLHRALVIRKWGTEGKGLGALVDGPTAATVLDPIPGKTTIRPPNQLYVVECRAEAWAGVFA